MQGSEPAPEGGWPIRGTVEVDGAVTSWSLPCVGEWLSEHESGNLQKQIQNDIRANYEEGTEYAFEVSKNGRYSILGEADDEEAGSDD